MIALPKPQKGAKAAETRARRNTRLSVYRRACRVVDARSVGCERCGVVTCWLGFHHHHLVHRSQGGADTPENLQRLCGLCHHRVHHENSRARVAE